MSRPSCWAGPEKATDWRRTTCESETPGACAIAAEDRASAAPRMRLRIMFLSKCVSEHDTAVHREESLPRRVGCAPLAREELAHLLHEALGARVVAVAVLAVDLFQLAQEVLLALGEPHRRLHHDLAQQVAGIAG